MRPCCDFRAAAEFSLEANVRRGHSLNIRSPIPQGSRAPSLSPTGAFFYYTGRMMRFTRRTAALLIAAALTSSPSRGEDAAPQENVIFPNLSTAINAPYVEPLLDTVSQTRMTLPELQSFFDALDRGRPVRLVYRNGSEYAGNYSGSESGKPVIYCRKGMARREVVPLETVTDAFVYVTDTELVRIHRLD